MVAGATITFRSAVASGAVSWNRGVSFMMQL